MCLTPVPGVCNSDVDVGVDLTSAGMREQVPKNDWVHKVRVVLIYISKPIKQTYNHLGCTFFI